MKPFIGIALIILSACSDNESESSKYVKGSKTDKDGNCFINTAEFPQSNGIDIDVYFPCTWFETNSANYEPTVIKQIGDTSQGFNIALVLMISKLIRDTLTPGLIDSLRSEMYLKGNLGTELQQGTISTDTLEINGLKGGKIITRNVLRSGQVAYGLNIHLFYKNSVVQLHYTVGAPTADEAISHFNKQEPLLMELARKTRQH